MTALEVAGLRTSFGTHRVLDGLDLSVATGSVTAILGSSGSGKSTLLRCVAGLLRPEAGTMRIAQHPVCDARVWVPAEKRCVGLVPQEGSLFPHLSVGDNVGFGLRGRNKRARVGDMLDLVGLPGTEKMRPHELSGGMQQRVAVARALAPAPQLILLDEPFSALDAGLRDDVRTQVFGAVRAIGATAVLVTHDQQEALAVADQVAVMMQGTIAQAAPPDEVYRQPDRLDVARFIGETVLLPGRATAGEVVHTPLGEVPVDRPAAAGTGTLMLRPEDLSPEGPGAPLGRARIIEVRYLGHECLVRARHGEHDVSVRVPGGGRVTPGDMIDLYVVRPGRFFPDPP